MSRTKQSIHPFHQVPCQSLDPLHRWQQVWFDSNLAAKLGALQFSLASSWLHLGHAMRRPKSWRKSGKNISSWPGPWLWPSSHWKKHGRNGAVEPKWLLQVHFPNKRRRCITWDLPFHLIWGVILCILKIFGFPFCEKPVDFPECLPSRAAQWFVNGFLSCSTYNSTSLSCKVCGWENPTWDFN